MVAYGMPVIHQSLATAPLDIKEAIDWLLRIGGKDVKGEGKDRTAELIKVVKRCFQQEGNATSAVNAINGAVTPLMSLAGQLAKFIGYDINGYGSEGHRQHNGSGIGRRGGQSILNDLHTGGFLTCCKEESICTSKCKCCQGDRKGGVICDPQSCPIQTVLDCSIPQTVISGSAASPSIAGGTNSKVCCIISFLISCFEEGKVLNHSPVQCQHCDGSILYETCHKDCTCAHTKVISKLACRINFLIQLASAISTLYMNKNVPICRTCQNCNVCNTDGSTTQCMPCSKCNDALKGRGEHCGYCRTGQCCIENNEKNLVCKSKCNSCQNCLIVRNTKAFWDMLDHVSYSCGKCTRCRSTSSPQERGNCTICNVCPGDSCVDGCKNRKRFGFLISELLHFMANNFGDVAYTLKGNITRLKDDCCMQRDKLTDCRCSESCCGSCRVGTSDCEDCKLYCICCVAEKHNGSCVCDNQCSEKLELLLRPAISGYVSAYDYNTATWEKLCKKTNGKRNRCSDQCTESCQCSSTDCPAEGCCTHCPKRQCAMILCMVVPVIYRFFEYINHQIYAELGDGGGSATSQWASALIDGDTHLGDLFRTCGFQSNRLKPIMGCQFLDADHNTINSSCRSRDHKPGNLNIPIESLKKAEENLRTAMIMSNLNSCTTTNYVQPTTVRDKLLWLCGLPYSDVYEELQQRLKDSMPNVSSSLLTMELTLRMALFTFHILEDSSQSFWQFVTQGFNVPNTKYSLHYNRDPVRLLWDVYDALYDVTCALTFMNKQCNVSSINSGWEDCKFGRDVNINGGHNDICQCQTGTCKSTCDHCSKVCKACRGDAKCVCCCPYCEQRPDKCTCMMRFITDNGSMTDASVAAAYRNGRYGPMGFRKSDLRKVEMRGAALYDTMSGLLTDDHAVFPRLLEYLLIARAGVPENLADYYALFLGLGMRLHMESHQNGGTDKTLLTVFKTSMRNTFSGAHEGIIEPVITAVRKLYKEDSGHASNGSGFTDASIHITSDLISLYGCYTGTACVGYMYSLSSGPYELFSRYPHAAVGESACLFTKWLFCGATSFYNTMRLFSEEVSTLECCHISSSCTCNSTNGNSCDCKDCNCFCQIVATLCSCGTVVKCKSMHPLLYRHGITFHEPDMWSSQKRRCKDFSDTLNRFIGRDSMLCQLIEAIEQFLWQIRLPFCIALLTLWATALCFLMYVFIGYLDRLGMRSRWLSRKPIAHPIQLFTSSMVKPMGGGGAVI